MVEENRNDETDNTGDPLWAWVALVGICYTQMWIYGINRAFGIMYVEFLWYFDQGPLLTGWVFSSFFIAVSISVVVSGWILDWRSYLSRWLNIAGAILGTSGYLIAAFAGNIGLFIFGYSVLAGAAEGILICNVALANKYFSHRRTLANGLCFASAGLGGVIMPFFCKFLIEEYTLRGALIVMAGCWMNVCVCGALLRPVAVEKSIDKSVVCNDKTITKSTVVESKICHLNKSYNHDENFTGSVENGSVTGLSFKKSASVNTDKEKLGHVLHEENLTSGSIQDERSSKKENCVQISSTTGIEVSSISLSQNSYKEFCKKMCSSSFMIYCAVFFIGFFNMTGVTQYIHHHSLDIGMTTSQGVTLVTVVGASDTISRLIFGFIGDRPCVNKKAALIVNLAIAGAATCAFPSVRSWSLLLTYTVIVGAFGTSYLVYATPIVANIVGIVYVGKALGICCVLICISGAVAPIAFGTVREISGSYTYPFLSVGVLYIISALLITAEFVASSRRTRCSILTRYKQ